MWCDEDVQRLVEGCKEVNVPEETAPELYKFLIVKKAAGAGSQFNLSKKLNKLLEWVLLNTEVRNKIEANEAIGKIMHFTQPRRRFSDEEKIHGRVAAMEAISAFESKNSASRFPNLFLWEDRGTIFENPTAIELTPKVWRHYPAKGFDLGEKVTFYCFGERGYRRIYDLIIDGNHECSVEDRQFLSGCRKRYLDTVQGFGVSGVNRLGRTRRKVGGGGGKEPIFQVFVKLLSGVTATIAFSLAKGRRASILDLKEAIEIREGIPAPQQRLIYTGRQPKDHEKLADIVEGWSPHWEATFHLVLRLKGC